MTIDPNPIFVVAIPRSGGTLLTTMLDAHEQVGMSYEIYGELLSDEHNVPYQTQQLLQALHSAVGSSPERTNPLGGLQPSNLRTFIARALRSGISLGDIIKSCQGIAESYEDFSSQDARLDLVESLMIAKATNLGRPIWGGKTREPLEELAERYSSGRFLMMYRDFRDILTSRRQYGFRSSDDAVASTGEWRAQIEDFVSSSKRLGLQSMLVDYEVLCRQPQSAVQIITNFLGIEPSQSMVHFERLDPPLFSNSFGHLSAESLKLGINSTSIGRWRKELPKTISLGVEEMLADFEVPLHVTLSDV